MRRLVSRNGYAAFRNAFEAQKELAHFAGYNQRSFYPLTHPTLFLSRLLELQLISFGGFTRSVQHLLLASELLLRSRWG
jgi:hypothetical protein